jgi:hypothetical protein
MDRSKAGSGGVAVSTKEIAALPPLQASMHPFPGAPLHDASQVELKSRTATAEVWRVIRWPNPDLEDFKEARFHGNSNLGESNRQPQNCQEGGGHGYPLVYIADATHPFVPKAEFLPTFGLPSGLLPYG